MATDVTLADPSPILDLLEAFRWSKTMFTAVSLGVFDALAAEPKSLDRLSTDLSLNADALERLLNACIGLQLLRRHGVLYENTPAAHTFLTRNSPHRLTGYLNYSNQHLWKLWGNLEGAIREGTHRWKETYGWEGPIFSHLFKDEESTREFLIGMHGFGLISSPRVVEAFDLGRFARLVDLGGATGHLAIAACKRYSHLRAVVFDLPNVVPLAEQIIADSPVAERIEIHAGDFFNDPLPRGDLYTLGRILHDWSEEKIVKLLGRIYDSLPNSGAVLVAEKLLLDDKTGPRWAHMQSLNMLTCTEGKERTLAEYEGLLRQVGFSEVVGCRTHSPLDAVLATKNSAA